MSEAWTWLLIFVLGVITGAVVNLAIMATDVSEEGDDDD